MLYWIVAIISMLLTISFVVGTHETAHFVVARLCGVKVLRFSIGFGKRLVHWYDKTGTEYVIAAIPLGGYVKMLDTNEISHETADDRPVTQQDAPFAFNHQPFYKKFLIIAAGPLTNLLCALVLYWFIFMIGFIAIKPIIGEVTPGSIAAQSGLKTQEQIIKIDNKITATWMAILFRLLSHAGDQDTIKIETKALKNNPIHTYQLNLTQWHVDALTPDPLGSLGIIPFFPKTARDVKEMKSITQTVQFAPLPAFKAAWQETIDLSYFNLLLFGKMVTGKLSVKSLGGPITIFSAAGSALNNGALSFISFLAFLSIAIGVINILPIPGLDGGHLLIQGIEWIIRRPLPQKALLLLYQLGFMLIIFVFIQAMINDILRLT